MYKIFFSETNLNVHLYEPQKIFTILKFHVFNGCSENI